MSESEIVKVKVIKGSVVVPKLGSFEKDAEFKIERVKAEALPDFLLILDDLEKPLMVEPLMTEFPEQVEESTVVVEEVPAQEEEEPKRKRRKQVDS
jgi:hypothetical protein